MNKKILTSLLIASIAITGLFAYTGKSAILNANKADSDYTFVIKYNDAGDNNTSTLDLSTEGIALDLTEHTTEHSFTVATLAKGNLKDELNITTRITTGPFTGLSSNPGGSVVTNSFPFIVDDLQAITGPETYSYAQTAQIGAKYSEPSQGVYSRNFRPGVHAANTVIAQFKLSLQGNDTIVAGDYTSTTTIDITT